MAGAWRMIVVKVGVQCFAAAGVLVILGEFGAKWPWSGRVKAGMSETLTPRRETTDGNISVGAIEDDAPRKSPKAERHYPVRNGGQSFWACLEALKTSNRPPDELIVVDDSSDDARTNRD